MNLIFYVLVYAYGLIMSGGSIYIFLSGDVPFWLVIINCISASILFLTPLSRNFLYIGLLLLLLSAVLNGFILNGFPNWKHLGIRLVFSLLLCILSYIQTKSSK